MKRKKKDKSEKEKLDKKDKKEKKDKKDKHEKLDKNEIDEGWKPVWFVSGKDHLGNPIWKFSNTYWAEREKRENKVKNGEDPGELITAPCIKGSAADFASYLTLWSDLLGKEMADEKALAEKAEKSKKRLKETQTKTDHK